MHESLFWTILLSIAADYGSARGKIVRDICMIEQIKRGKD